MTTPREPVDAMPESAFVREMRDALDRQAKASSQAEKEQIRDEMLDIMRRHLRIRHRPERPRRFGRGWWRWPRNRRGPGVDGKLAACGRDED